VSDLGLDLGDGLLDLFQTKLQLLGIKPLRAAPEVGALQLAKQVAQPIVLRNGAIALRNRSIALGADGITLSERMMHQQAQRFDVVREISGMAHAPSKIRFVRLVADFHGFRVNVSQRDRQ
jgi:hypothetical protein